MIDNSIIEKFFSNSLTEDELLEFKNQYNSNPEFKKEVKFLESLKVVSGHEDDKAFKATLKGFEVEASKKHRTLFSKKLYPIITVAAILTIGLFISIYWFSNTSEKDLFATYFEPSKNVSVPIVRDENSQNITTEAFILYAEKDYNKASVLFEKAYLAQNQSELLFYQGNALLALGHTTQAIEKFREHIKLQDTLSNRSHWYLALAYLKNDDLENAKKELNTFINTNENFKIKEAKSLLKKLN